jgi:hypothetical protein
VPVVYLLENVEPSTTHFVTQRDTCKQDVGEHSIATTYFPLTTDKSAVIAQSVKRRTTGRTVRGSNPGEDEISAAVQTSPRAHPATYTMGTGSFPGVKRPRRGVDHRPF